MQTVIFLAEKNTHTSSRNACMGVVFLLKLHLRVVIQPVQHIIYSGEAQAGYGIGTAIIDGNPSGFCIRQGCTGESHIGHIAHAFIQLPGGEDIVLRAYEITVEKTGKYTISYLDKILTNWHTTGYTTIEEIDEAQSRYSENKKEENKGSFDTDDFFERSLKRSMDNAVKLVKEKQSDKK